MFLPPPRRTVLADALPPGRLGYSLTAPRLLLHSVMSVDAYDVLRTDGVLRCDPAVAEPDFAAAYRWLLDRYADQVAAPAPPGLLWAWARIRRRDLIPNLRAARGQILVSLRVPRERVLTSDYNDWHAVLNRWELQPRELEHDHEELDRCIDRFWAAVDAAGVLDLPVEEWPDPLRSRVLRSWDLVFEVRPPPWPVQAVVDRFEGGEVVDAVLLE